MNFKKIFDSSRKDIDSAVNCSISLMNCGVEYPEYFKNESFLKKIYETIDYVLEQESEHYDILLLKSELLKNQNKLDEALELILKIQSIYPDDLQLKFNQASILLDMEKFHESIEIFCQIQGNFSHHKVLPKLSYAYYKTKSLEQFQNMIAIDRDIKNNKMPDVTYVLAKFEFDQKQWNTCSSLCSWLVKNHQGNPKYWKLLHKVLRELNEEEFSYIAIQTANMLQGNKSVQNNTCDKKTNDFLEYLDESDLKSESILNEYSIYFDRSVAKDASFDFEIKKIEKWLEKQHEIQQKQDELDRLGDDYLSEQKQLDSINDEEQRKEDEKFAEEFAQGYVSEYEEN